MRLRGGAVVTFRSSGRNFAKRGNRSTLWKTYKAGNITGQCLAGGKKAVAPSLNELKSEKKKSTSPKLESQNNTWWMVIIWWPLTSMPEAWDSSVGQNRPAQLQTRDQFFPLRETTHSQSHEETPGKIILPTRSHLKTFGEDALSFIVQGHIRGQRPERANTAEIVFKRRKVGGQVLPKFPCNIDDKLRKVRVEGSGKTGKRFHRTHAVATQSQGANILCLLIQRQKEGCKLILKIDSYFSKKHTG